MVRAEEIINDHHRDYSRLLCYQKSVIIYDLTYHFSTRFIDKHDRTFDQMIQAARSGKQNIVEGYVDSPTSTEMSIKLYNTARGSIAELLEDYKDYLRTRNLEIWDITSDKVEYMRKLGKERTESEYFIKLAECRDDETIANMAIVLIHQAETLLKKFIDSEIMRFSQDGGFREKMTKIRLQSRKL